MGDSIPEIFVDPGRETRRGFTIRGGNSNSRRLSRVARKGDVLRQRANNSNYGQIKRDRYHGDIKNYRSHVGRLECSGRELVWETTAHKFALPCTILHLVSSKPTFVPSKFHIGVKSNQRNFVAPQVKYNIGLGKKKCISSIDGDT